jgi:hypothetical protein
MKTYFNSKEQYLAFRAAWASAVNSKSAKKTTPTEQWGPNRTPGWITSRHMILFNILRNREADAGFTNVTNVTKLTNGQYVNDGFYNAAVGYNGLNTKIMYAHNLRDNPNIPANNFQHIALAKFLAPFNGTVTMEMLFDVELLDITPIVYANEVNCGTLSVPVTHITNHSTRFDLVDNIKKSKQPCKLSKRLLWSVINKWNWMNVMRPENKNGAHSMKN